MKTLLTIAILLAIGIGMMSSPLNRQKREPFSKEERDHALKKFDQMRTNASNIWRAKNIEVEEIPLVWNDKIKVPEIDCEKEYKTGKLPEDFGKGKTIQEFYDYIEDNYDETAKSCAKPSRNELNCEKKICGNDVKVNCICGPKKCDLDDDGFCKGSSSVFTIGTILNLVAFYLTSLLL